MLEVKGRVRLSGFGKFIQELPKSRSRTLMVYKAFFCYHCSSSSITFINNLLPQTTISVTALLLVKYIVLNSLFLVSSQNSSVFSSWKPESKEITVTLFISLECDSLEHKRTNYIDLVNCCIISSKKKLDAKSFIFLSIS